MFNQFLNLQEYLMINEKRLYLLPRNELLHDVKKNHNAERFEMRIDYQNYRHAMLFHPDLLEERKNQDAFYDYQKSSTPRITMRNRII